MNKAININLNGQLFYINDDAYDKLSIYLKTIAGFFGKSEGKDEIMSDIEARIAEMFRERVTEAKQVLSMHDVNDVIDIMGKPEDFREISGDSSGEPMEAKPETRRKRLFRDPENAKVGGVCSGLGAYFDVDPVWFRVIFVAMFFLFGSGPLLYIVLMLIMPKAVTASDRLEMKGEPVNINNIGKAFNEEFEGLKKKFEDLKGESKNRFSGHQSKVSSFFQELGDILSDVIKTVFKVLSKFIGLAFVIIAIVLLIMLVGGLLGSDFVLSISPEGISSFSVSELIESFFPSGIYFQLAKVSFLLLIGIPIISLIIGGVKLLFGIKGFPKYLSALLASFWALGLILAIVIAYFAVQDFTKKSTIRDNVVVNTKAQSLYLDINKDVFIRRNKDRYDRGEWYLINHDGNQLYFGNIQLDVIKSETDSFEIEVIKTARAGTKKESVDRASRIQYHFNQTDSIIKFDPYFKVNTEDKIRGQQLEIIVKVPEGKSVYLDSKMNRIIYDIDNVTNTIDEDMVGHTWYMDQQGLSCLDCR